MDETRARGLLQRAAAGQEPPSRVDVELARSRGRRKLRWRRASLAGVSAAAVVAVAVAAVAVPGSRGAAPGRGNVPQAHGPVTAPSRFNPLRPYATFGWLPAGESLEQGTTSPSGVQLTAGTGPAWQLQVYVAGFCDLTSGQLRRQLARDQLAQLGCRHAGVGAVYQVTSVATRVDGHTAFWTADQDYLIWQYANHGWAALASPTRAAARVMLKVARGVRYGTAGPPIKFPLQAVNLPTGWMALVVNFAKDAGVLRAYQYVLGSNGADAGAAIFTAGPASSCYSDGQSKRQTINGYQVIVRRIPSPNGTPPDVLVCASDADGLSVTVSTGIHASPDAVSIFRRDIRILGRNPADWTTQPLG
jgi:hypothetical protein